MNVYAKKQKSAVIILVIANVIAFGLQLFLGDWFTELFILRRGDLLVRPWTLFTSMFLHGGLSHLLFNMYALFLFGGLVEQRIGKKRFFMVYFVSGLLAALIGSFVYRGALGASAAIMGIVGVLIILNPDLKLLLFFVIPMSLRTAGIFWILLDLFGTFNPSNGVANMAHLIGIFTGLIYGKYIKKKSVKVKKKIFRPKEKLVLDEDDMENYMKYGRI